MKASINILVGTYLKSKILELGNLAKWSSLETFRVQSFLLHYKTGLALLGSESSEGDVVDDLVPFFLLTTCPVEPT